MGGTYRSARLPVRGPPATGRFRQKSTVGGRLNEKREEEEEEEKEEKKKKRGEKRPIGRARSSPVRRRRSRVASARVPSPPASRGRSFSRAGRKIEATTCQLKETTVKAIEDAFKEFTSREDIAVVLISQYIANMIRFLVDSYSKPVPAILEIPSKDHPYDPAHDSVLSRVRYLFSAESVASGRR
ncbi:hypothetical protein GW17_00029724 [Ensete ventricosum]|nr:hypothetical protein GW17_00029724 [Ensete ventricosum]